MCFLRWREGQRSRDGPDHFGHDPFGDIDFAVSQDSPVPPGANSPGMPNSPGAASEISFGDNWGEMDDVGGDVDIFSGIDIASLEKTSTEQDCEEVVSPSGAVSSSLGRELEPEPEKRDVSAHNRFAEVWDELAAPTLGDKMRKRSSSGTVQCSWPWV